MTFHETASRATARASRSRSSHHKTRAVLVGLLVLVRTVCIFPTVIDNDTEIRIAMTAPGGSARKED